MRDSTLIIIDAQNDYTVGKFKISNVETSCKAIEYLLQRYRNANGQVVHVIHDTPNGVPLSTPGTTLAEIFDELAPKPGEKIIHKNHPSSFAGTELQAHLESIGRNKTMLVGYMVSCSIEGYKSPSLNPHSAK